MATTERIDSRSLVETALYVIDADGLDSFTIRRLADTAGVFVNSVTQHLGSRAAVLAAVLDRVFEEVPPAPVTGGLTEALADHADALWAVLVRHRGIVPVLAQRHPDGPQAIRIRHDIRTMMALHGVTDPDLAADAFLTAVIGGAVLHVAADGSADSTQRQLPAAVAVLLAGISLLNGSDG